MTKLLVWTIGLVFFPFVVVMVVVVYAVWMVCVGLVALVVLMLRLCGVAVGLGWLATASGLSEYRRRRGQGRSPSVPGSMTAAEVAELRRRVGASASDPGRSVFRNAD